MIVDVHFHLTLGPPEMTKLLIQALTGLFLQYAERMGRPMDAETFIRQAEEKIPDPNGEKIIEQMEENEIDFSLLLMMDYLAAPVEYIQENNKIAGLLAQEHSDRLMALAGVDPRRPNATDLLKQCFEEFGCRGLKYHPDLGYDPTSTESYELLKILNDNKGVLLTHTGPLGRDARSRLAETSLLADVVVDFPDLPIIAAHMGFINWRPWASLAAYNPNFYGDLAMWDEKAIGNYSFFCRELRDLIDATGVEKVMFGTDDPFNTVLRPTKEYIQLIRKLPDNAPEGIQFTTEEVEAMLGGNAAALLGLTT
ncbi:MAG: amidohydrolase family protein [Desulfobacteraceae bacterium]|nr:amidohydrolase family protein [Desulfobacteraceae bacterium]